MDVTFNILWWIPIIVIPLIWTIFTRLLPADHFDTALQQYFKFVTYLAAIVFFLVTVIGFIAQHVTIS